MRKITQDLEGHLSIGILGGSFNPAHRGHLEVTRAARHLLSLDRCWWLVSPGNPLKDPEGYAPFEERFAAAEDLTRQFRWLTVSGMEQRLGTRFTVDTMRVLTARFRHARFVWLMGADSLATFHLWRDWRAIAQMVPIAVMSRPGEQMAALTSPAARALSRYRVPADEARTLAARRAPAWVYLPVVHNPVSSTEIREKRDP